MAHLIGGETEAASSISLLRAENLFLRRREQVTNRVFIPAACLHLPLSRLQSILHTCSAIPKGQLMELVGF